MPPACQSEEQAGAQNSCTLSRTPTPAKARVPGSTQTGSHCGSLSCPCRQDASSEKGLCFAKWLLGVKRLERKACLLTLNLRQIMKLRAVAKATHGRVCVQCCVSEATACHLSNLRSHNSALPDEVSQPVRSKYSTVKKPGSFTGSLGYTGSSELLQTDELPTTTLAVLRSSRPSFFAATCAAVLPAGCKSARFGCVHASAPILLQLRQALPPYPSLSPQTAPPKKGLPSSSGRRQRLPSQADPPVKTFQAGLFLGLVG